LYAWSVVTLQRQAIRFVLSLFIASFGRITAPNTVFGSGKKQNSRHFSFQSLSIYPNWSSSLVPEIFCRRSTAVWDINSTFNQERSKIKLIIEKSNLGIALNNETIQLPGSGEKKRTRKATTPTGSSDHRSQRNRSGNATPRIEKPIIPYLF